MCRSGSVKSFGIKRVCSLASADAIDSHYHTHYQQSVMIPVPGSCNSLQQAAADTAARAQGPTTTPIAVPLKRSSKTGSSISSQDLASHPAAAGQEAASGIPSSARKLAPIKTSVPKGPRMRLNGRLLSPEEAQKHLQAVAAAAAAAAAGRSLSRAQSPAITCAGRASPAGPHGSSSMSMSAGAPAISAGNSSGMCGPCSSKPPAYAAAGLPKHAAAPPPAAQAQVGCAAQPLDVLPENFIPTPDGAWNSLASTLEDDPCGATSGTPLVCSSYTELLMSETSSAFAAGAAPAAAPGNPSAFAAISAEPWPTHNQQPLGVSTGPLLLQPAGSYSNPNPGGLGLSSSCPVHIPMHSTWTSSSLLTGSVSGSNGSCGGNSLAASLAAPATGHNAGLAGPGPSAAANAELTQLLDTWAPQQQARPQQQAVVAFTAAGGSMGPSMPWVPAATPAAAPAWKPAFAAAGNSSGASTGMVPTPAFAAAGGAAAVPADPSQQQQQPVIQVSRSKAASSRTKRQSKLSTAKHSKQQQQAAAAPMLLVADGGQQMVVSQQELMAVLQQNMAASFASGYLMAQQAQPQQVQQPQLLKPIATIGPFVMPAAATATDAVAAGAGPAAPPGGSVDLGAPGSMPLTITAAAAAAVGSSVEVGRLVGGHAVDDILPSLQELLTDCC